MPEDIDAQIAAIRHFNRFYTRHVGALEEALLKSPFSLTEARVIYELAQADRTASDLSGELRLDPGYLSRLLKGLRERDLVSAETAPEDGRRLSLSLTEKGRAAFAILDERSREEVRGVLAHLSGADRAGLVAAMDRIERLLGPRGEASYLLRPHRIGDLGIIVARQAELYAEEFGWNAEFEALLFDIAASLAKRFDPAREVCWIAEMDGEIVGSAAVVRDPDDAALARLRIVYVDARARGLGIGRRLVEECLRFARRAGYARMTLYTYSLLVSARRIYEAAGFELVEEWTERSYGHDLVGQQWSRDL